MNRNTTRLVAPILLAATLTLTACGGADEHAGHPPGETRTTASTPTGTPAAGAHNAADVTFASGMIPHHGQAITMADMALKQGTSEQVKSLATQIKAAQDPEIQTMSGWLKGWGRQVADAQGMHHGGEGMMSMDDMGRLEKATGTAFDQMWLQMMIEHHEGAVAMSRTELSAGSNPQAKQLAQAIIDGQTKEIATMQTLLAGG